MERSLGLSACTRLLAVVLVGLAPESSRAGSIAFNITSTVQTQNKLAVKLQLRNTGDEAASAVKPSAFFEDRVAIGEPQRSIAPKQSHEWALEFPGGVPATGTHVALVRVSYEDANGYPFEIVSTASFNTGGQKRDPIRGAIQIPALSQGASGKGTIRLTIPKSRGAAVDVKLAIPGGLTASKSEFRVEANASTQVEIPVEIKNVSLLPGTTVNVFALASIPGEAPPQTDIVRGDVRIIAAATPAESQNFTTIAVALLLYAAALEVISGFRRRPRKGRLEESPSLPVVVVALTALPTAFLLSSYPWDALLSKTITAGGDMASLYYPTKLLAEEILPSGQLTGWTMGNYTGFPVFHFYSTLPFVLIALAGKLIAMPVAFKLVTLLGPTLLPLAAAFLFRCLGYAGPAPALAAASVLPFLLQQGNSMWGGNIPSVLAGEFCHSIGIMLSLVFLGVLHRTVQGRGSWTLAGVLLGVIGLCHTFAFFAAAWYSLFFIWPRRDLERTAPPTLAAYGIAFLLLCFWGLPLPSRLVFTSEWSMIWNIKEWKEVLPRPLWPAAVLSLTSITLSAVRLKEFDFQRQGLLLFVFCGGIVLYFLVPAIGFPDIRFVPISQLFLGFIAADFVAWILSVSRHNVALSAAVVAAILSWSHAHLGYIPSWLRWNYSGYEGKSTWKQFKEINDVVRGDMNDPRVVFEHSQAHNRFGSSRAFENLPLFSGRSTLEGVFHQASQNSPFIFYLQSEISEKGSGPFPQYTYARLNPASALPHLRLYNVGTIIAVSEKARQAYEQNAAFKKVFSAGDYAVFDVEGGSTGYVVAAANEPVLYDGPKWKLAFYRWFRRPEILDIPLVPADLIDKTAQREFSLRTDAIERLPRQPLPEKCEVTSRLEQYRIHIQTSCPGRPHIVKVSYFPRWYAADGARLLPVSPGFMLLYPTSAQTELVYRRNTIDWVGLVLTLLGVSLLVVLTVNRRLRDAVPATIRRLLTPAFAFVSRTRRTLSVVLLLLAVIAAAGTRWSLRTPDREYDEAQEAYKAKDFTSAARLFEDWTREDRDTFKQATALYQLGVCHTELNHPAAAVVVHERLRFQFPNIDYTAGTLFYLARNYSAIGSLDEARNRAAELLKGFADSSWVRRVQTELPQLVTPSGAT